MLAKYAAGFKLALSNELIYRTNFLFGQLSGLITYAAILYLTHALPNGAGSYDAEHLTTYVFGAAFLTTLLFTYGMHGIAREIAEGDLINYLLRPLNYLLFWVARLLANRFLLFVSGIVQIGLLLVLFPSSRFFLPSDPFVIWSAVGLAIGGIVLQQLIDLIGGLFSFWTHRSHGPRWMITTLITFLSGSYLPLDLFPSWFKTLLSYTPFPSLVFVPLKVFLGDVSRADVVRAFTIQGAWVTAFFLILIVLWKKSVRGYEAYGR